ncbi:unnamed protein product [marine sediment metagenome]|uniref:Uncharacterized protein n=1 Tax=marine sediment metagenome TaxID=412755 RepID=X1QGQ8_9ZZZZ
MPEILPDNVPSPRTPLGWDTVRYRPLSIDAAGNLQVVIVGGRVGMYRDYVHVQDQKARNTPGGGFTLGAWRTRDINTELADTGGICAIAANQITLQAGVYQYLISCPAFKVEHHQAVLYNVTAAVIIRTGTSEISGAADAVMSRSVIVGRTTLAIASVLEIRHQSSATRAGDGFGSPANITAEVYTVAEFWREW